MKIIAVDLDGTLAECHEWRGDEIIGPPIPTVVFALRMLRRAGWKIIIFTTRGQGAYPAIVGWLQRHAIPYDYINRNPDQPLGTNQGKVLAHVYLDDRAVNPLAFDSPEKLFEAITELRERLNE